MVIVDWVSQLVDWVGLDLAKWTHVQLWVGAPLVFPTPSAMAIFLWAPTNGGVKYKRGMQKSRFSKISSFIWEMIQDTATVTIVCK